VLLGALYLYGKWADRRKRKSSTAEESEPLSDGSGTTPDCEKGFPKASKNKKNESVDDHMVRPLCVESTESLLTAFRTDFDYPSTSTSLGDRHHPRRVQSPQVLRPMINILQASPKPTHTWGALPLFYRRFASYDMFQSYSVLLDYQNPITS